MSDEKYFGLPNYESGWDESDWEAIFEGRSNARAPEWTHVMLGGIAEPCRPEQIAEIEAVWTACNVDYADSEIVALFRLTDGRYATVTAWSDSSGWGCQDATYWKIAANRDEAIMYGLDNEGRERLNSVLPAASVLGGTDGHH